MVADAPVECSVTGEGARWSVPPTIVLPAVQLATLVTGAKPFPGNCSPVTIVNAFWYVEPHSTHEESVFAAIGQPKLFSKSPSVFCVPPMRLGAPVLAPQRR